MIKEKMIRKGLIGLVLLAASLGILFPEGTRDTSHSSLPEYSDAGKEIRLQGELLVFPYEGYDLELDLRDLSCRFRDSHNRQEIHISKGAFPRTAYKIDRHFTEIVYPEQDLRVKLRRDAESLSLEFFSGSSQTLSWPSTPLSAQDNALLLPAGEGLYIPLEDKAWRRYLQETPRSLSEFLTMPFWGVEYDEERLLTFLVSNPFHNTLHLEKNRSGNRWIFHLDHWFPDNHDRSQSIGITLFIDPPGDLLQPARHFRRQLIDSNEFVSFREKAEAVPAHERLIGAAHGVLHGGDLFTIDDILPGKASALAAQIVREAAEDVESLGARIRAACEAEDSEYWQAVVDLSEFEWKAPYPRLLFCNNISRILSTAEFYDTELARAYGLPPREEQSLPWGDPTAANSNLFYAGYSEFLHPPATWGGSVSTKMIDMVRRMGFDRFRFQIDGVEQVSGRPETAVYADKLGYLFGPYDSYHSIHDPRYAGTDMSWPTAQFDQYAFDHGGIQGQRGSSEPGFLRRGKKFSPRFARSYYEERIRENFDLVPFNYYFIDCDAYGEYFDDYTPERIMSQREDAEERVDRIRWLTESQSVPVGSEGGFYLFAPVVSLAEGLIYPVIGWGDEDMRDPDSVYFTGKHWPPYEPTIHFDQVPLKEEYYHLFIDPRFKLPLYEAVFHDSVISIPRDGGTRKYTNAQATLELCHLLYQIPPLYHLSLGKGEEILQEALPLYEIFRDSHSYSISYPLQEFAYLSEDRLVQRSVFGDLEILANFKDEDTTISGRSIPGMSAVLTWNGEERVYSALQ